jgi:hypothetical protein
MMRLWSGPPLQLFLVPVLRHVIDQEKDDLRVEDPGAAPYVDPPDVELPADRRLVERRAVVVDGDTIQTLQGLRKLDHPNLADLAERAVEEEGEYVLFEEARVKAVGREDGTPDTSPADLPLGLPSIQRRRAAHAAHRKLMPSRSESR